MNCNIRTLFFSIFTFFRIDLYNQRSHMGGHMISYMGGYMISHMTCHIDVT